MTVQIFLTAWLIVQMVFGTLRAVEFARLKKLDENKVIGNAIGTVFKFVGIFACLYFGGFYN